MSSGIYIIENIINNKKYVGCAINFDIRWREHKNKLRKLRHENEHLQKSWNKYGEKSFIFYIVEECLKEYLHSKEIEYIIQHRSSDRNYGYNLTSGGNGVIGLDEMASKRRSDALKGNRNSVGRVQSAESKVKQIASLQGLKKSSGISSKYVGVYYDKANKAWVANTHHLGKHHTSGYFTTEISAALAYNELVMQIFGKNASQNVISDDDIRTNKDEVNKIIDERLSRQYSKYLGVTLDKKVKKNQWRVRLSLNGQRINAGYFMTEIEAALAYNEIASEYLGYKAKLNSIPEEEINSLWEMTL